MPKTLRRNSLNDPSHYQILLDSLGQKVHKLIDSFVLPNIFCEGVLIFQNEVNVFVGGLCALRLSHMLVALMDFEAV